jgi:hypothetical protein
MFEGSDLGTQHEQLILGQSHSAACSGSRCLPVAGRSLTTSGRNLHGRVGAAGRRCCGLAISGGSWLSSVGHAHGGAVLLRGLLIGQTLLTLLHLLLSNHPLLLLELVLLVDHGEEVARFDELGIGFGYALLLHLCVALRDVSKGQK